MALKYNYPAAGANNGQMAAQQDLISGEVISYQYDMLKRLSSSTSNQGWGQGFTYDGFGNLAGKSALSGNPPVGFYGVDPATNRLWGGGYDANGNQTSMQGSSGQQMYYDVSNRMTGGFGIQAGQGAAFEYDIGNQRIYQPKRTYNGSDWVQQSEEWYSYGITGQKLGTYQATLSGTTLSWAAVSAQVFFGPKLIRGASGNVQEDIRGSIGAYFAYDEDRAGGLGNDAVKFATYTRDSMTGLDYASQRYHLPGMGRFLGVDPFGGSASAGDPGSWNRFTYAGGDPIDGVDPNGLDTYTFYTTGYGAAPGTSITLYLTPSALCLYSPSGGCYCASVNAANQALANMFLSMGSRPSRPVGRTDNARLNALVIQMVGSGTKCNDYLTIRFGTGPNHGTVDGLISNTANVTIIDATVSNTGDWNLSAFVPGLSSVAGQSGPIRALTGNDPAFVPYASYNSPSSYRLSPTIVLGQAFYQDWSSWDSRGQAIVAAHEMLHVYTGLNDGDLARALGLTPADSTAGAASDALNEWLKSDCARTNFR